MAMTLYVYIFKISDLLFVSIINFGLRYSATRKLLVIIFDVCVIVNKYKNNLTTYCNAP